MIRICYGSGGQKVIFNSVIHDIYLFQVLFHLFKEIYSLRKTEREKTLQLVIVMSDKSLHVGAGRRDVPQLGPGEEQGKV